MDKRAHKRMPDCDPKALGDFADCLSAYIDQRADLVDLRSAALGVWNCVDPLPKACADLVVALTGEQPPLRYSQAARQILRGL